MPADRAQPAPTSPSESASRIGIDVRQLPGARRLVADYAYDFQRVASYFSGDPSNPAAWRDAIARTQAHTRHRARLAEIVAAQQARRQAPPASVDAGRRLADPRAVAVMTGQQAALFGGPLYTLLKALTAIQVAERLSREEGVPAVAVFWVECEDHDWDEVRSCTVFDADLAPRTVSLAPRAGDPIPVASIRLDESIRTALDELEAALPATEFRDSVLADLRRAYQPGAGVADAFGCWLEQTLGPRGLVVYDASDPAAKPLVKDIFVRELSTPGVTTQLAASAGAKLAAGGYHSQVEAQDDGVALFYVDGARRPIRRQDGEFVVGDARYPLAALVEQAGTEPVHFSPNVLLRPIIQDAIFPTVCYVAGPSELAYLGQLGGIYAHFGIPMPLVYARNTATLVDSATMRFLTKHDLRLEALQPRDEAALNDLLASQMPPEVEQSFAGATHAIQSSMAAVMAALPAVDPTLEGAARSTLSRMEHDLQTLNGKVISAAKRRDDTLRRQFTRAQALVFPNGHPQERTIGFTYFLNQYGPALIDRLLAELPLEPGRHWVVNV